MGTQLLCYNRGCGRQFNPRDNPPDSEDCKHHPGAPFFHETYKGWTCCNKKSSDFTEFLNTPGCARGRHSREKPIEPENITGKLDNRSLEEQLAEINGSSSDLWRVEVKTRMQISPRSSNISRGHEILVLLSTKNIRFSVISKPRRMYAW